MKVIASGMEQLHTEARFCISAIDLGRHKSFFEKYGAWGSRDVLEMRLQFRLKKLVAAKAHAELSGVFRTEGLISGSLGMISDRFGSLLSSKMKTLFL